MMMKTWVKLIYYTSMINLITDLLKALIAEKYVTYGCLSQLNDKRNAILLH